MKFGRKLLEHVITQKCLLQYVYIQIINLEKGEVDQLIYKYTERIQYMRDFVFAVVLKLGLRKQKRKEKSSA